MEIPGKECSPKIPDNESPSYDYAMPRTFSQYYLLTLLKTNYGTLLRHQNPTPPSCNPDLPDMHNLPPTSIYHVKF